jgi:hypothetical protein
MKAVVRKVLGLKEKAKLTEVFDGKVKTMAVTSHYFVK